MARQIIYSKTAKPVQEPAPEPQVDHLLNPKSWTQKENHYFCFHEDNPNQAYLIFPENGSTYTVQVLTGGNQRTLASNVHDLFAARMLCHLHHLKSKQSRPIEYYTLQWQHTELDGTYYATVLNSRQTYSIIRVDAMTYYAYIVGRPEILYRGTTLYACQLACEQHLRANPV